VKDPFTAAYLGNLWRANDDDDDLESGRKSSKTIS